MRVVRRTLGCGPRCRTIAIWLLAGACFASPAQAATHLTATTPAGKIVIANGDGSDRRVLGDGGSSYVSPDGNWVAVRDWDQGPPAPLNHRLELYASAGGPPAHVLAIECLSVHWSPDSTKLACVDLESGATDPPGRLLVIDAATGAETTLGTGYFHSRVSFSPDSARLAYVQNAAPSSRGGALKVVELATQATTTLRRRAAAPAWGPRAIAFSIVKPGGPTGRTLDVAVVKANGTGYRRLTRFRARFVQSGLSPVAWSANGTRLLAALGGQDTFVAYAVNPRRGGARRIHPFVTPSALSRDGRFVIGGDNTEASYDPASSNVVRVPWNGGKARVLLRRSGSPSFNG